MLKNDYFEKVEPLLKSGDFSKALHILQKLFENKGLSPKEKVKLSQAFIWVGDPEKALKVLGKMIPINEMSVLTSESLLVQVRLAFMLNFLGATFMAGRIYKKIEEIISERDIFNKIDKAKFYAHIADYYFTSYHYKDAYHSFQLSCQLSKDWTERWIFSRLGMADNTSAIGNSEEALSIVNELIKNTGSDKSLFHAIFNEAKGEYLFRSGRIKEAVASFKKSKKLFGKKITIKDYAYLLYWYGVLEYKQGNDHIAREMLNEGLAIARKHQFQPRLTRQFLIWLELAGEELALEDRIAARLHHSFLPLVGALGIAQKHRENAPLHHWIKDQLKTAIGNVVIISRGELIHQKYDAANVHQNDLILDLASLSIRKKGKHKYEFLTEIEGKILFALLGSGSLGINQYSLSDFVYRQDFYNIDSGIQRIKAKMPTIKKIIPVKKIKKFYFVDYSKIDFTIILPMIFSEASPLRLLKSKLGKSDFVREDVEGLFEMSPRTAQRSLKEWEANGLIKKAGSGRSSRYIIL